jgi:transketolase
VGRDELRHYGSREEHRAAHGLDPASLRARIGDFLGSGHRPSGSGQAGYGPTEMQGRERSHAT